MLASRQLPPPLLHRPPPTPPLPTFYNIPRKYVKSSMQVKQNSNSSEPDSPKIRRKSSRIQDLLVAPTSHPGEDRIAAQKSSSTPFSPRTSKRKSSQEDQEPNGIAQDNSKSPVDSRVPRSALSIGSGELSGHVCLCQPEPKIPRPRNAFILYRQHHQHAIAVQNPGLPNPDISKIIGEQWKSESAEQKLVWQILAQEEKTRHQEQYPDYRYQPRRVAKHGSPVSSSPGALTLLDNPHCAKCGGRSIRTPTSPYSTYTTTLAPINTPDSESPTSRHLPSMASNLSLESPAYRRRGPGPSNLSNIQVTSPAHAHGDTAMYSPLTPDSKRRRYNNYSVSSASNGRRGEGPVFLGRRESLPAVHTMLRPSPPNTATMPPPRTPRDVRRASVDLNILVPNQHDQSRSVEAMVMSVPYQVKIKVLGRITPPLKDPGPTSPAVRVRGAIIAVEGDNLSDIKELSTWLKDFFAKEPELSPRLFKAPKAPVDGTAEVTFEDYLDMIRDWHTRSKELVEYITTPGTTATPPSSEGSSSDKESDKDSEDNKDKKSNDLEEKSKPATTSTVKRPPPPSPSTSPKPIAILPTYQLSASDSYTSRIPIQDAYSPTDHWQWMATLWRGTVGPDLTVYINSVDGKEGAEHRGKQVDVNEEVRLLTVKKDKDGKIDESALRRVGFEVGEWVRGIGTRGRGR